MKKIVKIFPFLLIPVWIQAQTETGFDIVMEYNKKYVVDFSVYNAQNQIIKKIESQENASQSTPEGLVQSHFSASNVKWVKSNYFQPEIDKDSRESRHFDFIKKMDKDKNNIKLLDKYCFELDGKQHCNVFYLIEYEGEKFKFPTILSCVKMDSKWFIYNLSNQFNLSLVLMQMKPEKLKELILSKQTGDVETDKLISETRNDEGGLDINKLYNFLVFWNKNNDSKQLTYFTNK